MTSEEMTNRIKQIVKSGNLRSAALLLGLPVVGVTMVLPIMRGEVSLGASAVLCIGGVTLLVTWIVSCKPLLDHIDLGVEILRDLERLEEMEDALLTLNKFYKWAEKLRRNES